VGSQGPAEDAGDVRTPSPGRFHRHQRAASDKEHIARIDAIVARWVNGEILTHQKRHLIEAENELHKPKTGAKTK
jgi:hypothetical protein